MAISATATSAVPKINEPRVKRGKSCFGDYSTPLAASWYPIFPIIYLIRINEVGAGGYCEDPTTAGLKKSCLTLPLGPPSEVWGSMGDRLMQDTHFSPAEAARRLAVVQNRQPAKAGRLGSLNAILEIQECVLCREADQ